MAIFGYLDPGTGSIIVQTLIGVGAGLAFFGRRAIGTVIYKVRSLFSKKDTSNDEDDE